MTDSKGIVRQAMAELMGPSGVDKLEPLLSEDFVHHRPDSTTRTKTEWLADVRAALEPLADMQIDIQHILADGDLVVIHTRRRLPDSGPETTVVDILRVDDGLIAEVWETIEPATQAAANLSWWER